MYSVEVTDADLARIRQMLRDYYGSALCAAPMAMADLIRVDAMSPEELVQTALDLGLIQLE